TLFSGKVDLGTGIRTAMAQIAAEELDVGFDSVTVVQGDTLLTPDQGPTYASLSIQNGGMQIRPAAATARQHLVGRAALRLGTPAWCGRRRSARSCATWTRPRCRPSLAS